MKKGFIFLALFVTFILLYLLQANFFNWFTIAGIKPNLFIILILFIGLFAGKHVGVTSGIFCGLLLDLWIGKKLGISAMLLGTIGFLGGYFDKNFSKESRITIMLMVMGATVIFEVGSFCLYAMIFSYSIDLVGFVTKLLIEILYNVILTIIFYPFMQKAGFTIEEVLKGKKILTRYF